MFDYDQDAYRSLRGIIAERTRPVIAWVGSGLSMAAGLPSWSGLKDHLLDALYRRAFGILPQDGDRLARIADGIKAENNYWIAFERLKKALGPVSYRDLVREALESAVTASIPEPYRLLWRLPINGVLTLNLDRMATRAYVAEYPEHAPIEFVGEQVGRLLQVMHTERKFIANIHGIVDDESTWIFTNAELRGLQKKPFYSDFLRLCLSSFTNLFLGMTIDDVAVGAHLYALSQLSVAAPSHFWITDRTDRRTDSWAESVGVRVIRYRPRDGDHVEVAEALNDLGSASPVEPPPAPPIAFSEPTWPSADDLLAPADMLSLSAEEIRERLNREASRILQPETEDSYKEYEAFIQDYDEVIFRAWYTSDKPGRNQLLGYTLNEQVATGAFGRVYRAQAPDGREVAVKVLLEEVRRDSTLLRSFRRGVRSMRILQRSDVDGMVAYETASEIPAFVTMEWIEGPNLSQAKQAQLLEDWADVLNIGKRLTAIIRSAHALPHRVLHRDIRPANVMLREYWSNPDDFEVVVLDFDLSWHRGAQKQSVVHTTAVGYLAPEQILASHDGSTRNAAVDAFGIGMTMYFLCGGKEPLPELHRHADYTGLVAEATNSLSQSDWKSLPKRMTRLIIGATRDRQSQRWDLSQMYVEMERLHDVHVGKVDQATAAMVAEELAARTDLLARYQWKPDENGASCTLPTGLSLQLSSNEPTGNIALQVAWTSTGTEQRVGMAKYVSRGTRTLSDRLRSFGWTITNESNGNQSMILNASKDYRAVRADITGEAAKLDAALMGLRFSE